MMGQMVLGFGLLGEKKKAFQYVTYKLYIELFTIFWQNNQ